MHWLIIGFGIVCSIINFGTGINVPSLSITFMPFLKDSILSPVSSFISRIAV